MPSSCWVCAVKTIKSFLYFIIPATIFCTKYTHAEIRVPPGFEELARNQSQWVEVFLYGKSMGVFEVNVNLKDVTFIDAEKLFRLVKTNINNDQNGIASIKNAIGKPLARNGQLACYSNGDQPGCDYIKTNSIAVIYDENLARISLFINEKYINKKTSDDGFYHQTTDISNALIHQQNINFVADKNYQSASIQGSGALGVTKAGYINTDWSYIEQKNNSTSSKQADIYNAYYRQDLDKRHYVQLGLMDSRDIFSNAGGNITLSQLPIGKIKGMRTGTTLAWTDATKQKSGTPLIVVLSNDSRVDAYKGKQLLSTSYLKAGVREIDTTNFPPGSYNVSLMIYENNHFSRQQDVPYTNVGSQMGNSLQWFAQAGQIASSDSVSDNGNSPSFQGGLRLPVTSQTSLTGGTSWVKGREFWEGALDWSHGFDKQYIDGVLTGRASYLYGSDDSTGNIQQLNYNDGFSLSFYRTALSAPDCSSNGRGDYAFSGCYKSTIFMVSVPVQGWYANLSYSVDESTGRYVLVNNDAGTSSDIGIIGSQPRYYTHGKSDTWQLSMSRAFPASRLSVSTSISAFKRSQYSNLSDYGGFVSMNVSLTSQANERRGPGNASVGINYASSKQSAAQTSYNASYTRYKDETGDSEVGAQISGVDSDNVTSSVYTRSAGNAGNGALNLTDAWDRTQNSHLANVSGSYSSTLALTADHIYLGRWGNGTPGSAVSFDISGEDLDSDAAVNVGVEGSSRADIAPGYGKLFTIAGYQPTQIEVNESQKSSHGVSSSILKGYGETSVFATPGKIIEKHIKLVSHYTWLGRLLDEKQEPMQNITILNATSFTSLGEGGYTLETDRKVDSLYVLRNSQLFKCEVNAVKVRDVVTYFGTSTCRNISLASAPKFLHEGIEALTKATAKR